MRILVGLVCLALAGTLTWPAVKLFPIMRPLAAGLKTEDTTTYVLHIGVFVNGWAIVAVEALLVALCLGLMGIAVYAFVSHDRESRDLFAKARDEQCINMAHDRLEEVVKQLKTEL